MDDLHPEDVIDLAQGQLPRPEFVAELRAAVEREALTSAGASGEIVHMDPSPDEGSRTMSRTMLIGAAVAVVAVMTVGLAVWLRGGDSASNVTTVDEVIDETATTLAPEIVPAPAVPRPDPAPPAEPSDLSFDDWLVAVAEFAENRHEGDWQHFVAGPFGQLAALEDQALDNVDGYRFTSQCDLLPVTSSHLAEAPGLPQNAAIAEAYQELLDLETSSWAFLEAKCDSVDHELVRAGLAEFPSLDTVSDYLRGGSACARLRTTIETETGTPAELICMPQDPGARDVENDRELPEDFRTFLEGYAS